MARITDENRLERLKQSTMKYVVEKGYGGASAVLIAKEAKVAVGYFYLHYKGKYEMVNCLLHDVYQEIIDKLNELFDRGSSFNELIKSLIGYFFKMANEESIKAKFVYVLTNDYSFQIDGDVKATVFQTIGKIKKLGNSTKELDAKITEEDLYLILVNNVIQFINQRFKSVPEALAFSEQDQNHLEYLIYKVLK